MGNSVRLSRHLPLLLLTLCVPPSSEFLDPLADYALPPDLVPPPDLPSLSLANLPRTAVWAEALGSSARLPCDIQVVHKHIRDKSVCNFRKICQRPLSRKSGKSLLMKKSARV
jgi:hypothetical protein